MKNKSLLSIVKNIIKCKQYKNLSEDKKQKLVKYSKKYYKTRKKCLTIIKRNYYIKKKWLRKFFWESNFEAINSLQKADWNKRSGK